MPRGGRRPGAGRPKGSKSKKTVAREMAEEELRSIIKQHLPEMVASQLANATGLKYLVVRNKKTGKFERVAENAAKALKGGDEEIIEVWEKDPNVNAFKELLDRGFGKSREPDRKVDLDGTILFKWEGEE